jgi:hypothetical protein
MPTPPIIPPGLTEHGKDLLASIWEAEPLLQRLPNGVVAMPPTRRQAAEFASRDVGAAALDTILARVYTNERDHTVSLLLDEHTAAAAIWPSRSKREILVDLLNAISSNALLSRNVAYEL